MLETKGQVMSAAVEDCIPISAADVEGKTSDPPMQLSYVCPGDEPESVQDSDSDRTVDASTIINALKSGRNRDIKKSLMKFQSQFWNLKEEFLEQDGVSLLTAYIMNGHFYHTIPLDVLTKLLTSHEECIKSFVDDGGVDRLVKLLKSKWRPLRRAALNACPLICSTSEGRQKFCSSGGIAILLKFFQVACETFKVAARVMSLLAEDEACRQNILQHHGLVYLDSVTGPQDALEPVVAAIADLISAEHVARSVLVELGLTKYIQIVHSAPKQGQLCAQGARLLSYAVMDPHGVDKLLQLNGLTVLCGILDLGQTESEFWVLSTLESISKTNTGANALVLYLDRLLQTLQIGNQRCREKVLSCIHLMTYRGKLTSKHILSKGVLPLVIRELQDDKIHYSAIQILPLLMDNGKNCSDMKSAIGPLLKLTSSTNSETQADAVSCLARLSTSDVCVSQIIAEGGIESVVKVLRSGVIEAENWAMKCLALLSHGEGFRMQIQDDDLLETLTKFLQDRSTRTQCISAICIANILGAHPRMKRKFVSSGATTQLLEMLQTGDSGLRGAVLLVLSKISNLQACKELLSNSSATMQTMKAMVVDGSDAVRECIAIIVSHIASISTTAIIRAAMQTQLFHLLDSSNPTIVANTANTLRLVAEKYAPLRCSLTTDSMMRKLLTLMRGAHESARSTVFACMRAVAREACNRMDLMPAASGYHQLVDLLVSSLFCSGNVWITEAVAVFAAFAEERPSVIQSMAYERKAIFYLAKLLKSKTVDYYEEAAHTIALLIDDHGDNQLELVKCSGYSSLMKAFTSGSPGTKRHCAKCIGILALSSTALNISLITFIEPLVSALTSPIDTIIDESCHEEICQTLANLATRDPEQQLIGSEGGIAKLIEQVAIGYPGAQKHAARALANLSCNEENSMMIGKEGGIDVLAKLLSSSNEDCRKQAACALANLVYENPENAAWLRSSGCLPVLSKLMSNDDHECNEHAFRIIGNLAGPVGKICLSEPSIVCELLRKFLQPETTPAVHESIVRAVTLLVQDNAEMQEVVLKSGLAPPLLSMLKESTGSVRDNIIKILACLACGNDGRLQEGASNLGSMRAQCLTLVLQEMADHHKVGALPDREERFDPDQEIPRHYLCPITQDIMQDPVIASDGHTYDRLAISEWFRTKASSPMTNQTLSDTRVFPNILLTSIIEEFVQKSGGWDKFID